MPQKTNFKYFGALSPEVTSEDSFLAFWGLGPRSGQKWAQKAHFEHFGALSPEVARSDLRRIILSILGPWSQKLSEVASEY